MRLAGAGASSSADAEAGQGASVDLSPLSGRGYDCGRAADSAAAVVGLTDRWRARPGSPWKAGRSIWRKSA